MKDPQLPEPWPGIRNATEESEPCWERDLFSGKYRGSEDCLYLNVFTQEVILNQFNILSSEINAK